MSMPPLYVSTFTRLLINKSMPFFLLLFAPVAPDPDPNYVIIMQIRVNPDPKITSLSLSLS